MGFNPPYYMTGPASRPGAMKTWTKNQKAIAARKGKPPAPPKKPTPKKPKVVATFSGSNTATSTATTKSPVTRPKTTGTITKKNQPVGSGKKTGGKKVTVPKNPPRSGGSGTSTSVGFNPQKMADTMTDLGYDADLAAIQHQIDMNRGNMSSALKDIQGWAAQVEDQRAVGAASAAQAWQGALQQNRESDANISGLFGGQAGGESAAYAGAGQDMLGALSASDQSFDARMAPILAAQSMDYSRRATAGFNQDLKGLQVDQNALRKEKGQAYQKNLMDMMDMAWGRKQDVIQNQIAQEALRQSKAMAGIEVTKGQQEITQGKQAIAQNAQQIKADKLSVRKSQIELKKLVDNPNGVDWNDPATRSQIGNAAFAGSISPRNTLMVNPKIAMKNAMLALQQMGLEGDPRAQRAIQAAFAQLLNYSHGHKQWTAFSLNQKGQLVYDPTKKRKK